MNMRAIWLKDIGILERKTIPIPSPGPGEVLIRVHETGICGSDLSTYMGEHPYKKPPTVLGHEFSGVVIALGPAVTDFNVGDKVCSAAYSNCGDCSACCNGRPSLCNAKTAYSFMGWEGSFAEYVIGRVNKLFLLPPDMPNTIGALIEPLSIGLHALRQAGSVNDKSVGIIGSGNIGLACLQASKLLGTAQVTCIDVDEGKQDLAIACGADVFLRVGDEEKIADWEQFDGFDITILAASYDSSINDATRLTSPGGTVVLVAYFSGSQSIDANDLVKREISVVGSALSDDEDFRQIIEWVNLGNLDPSPMVSHKFPLSDAEKAFNLMKDPSLPNGKIILELHRN